jgi:amino acid transporter
MTENLVTEIEPPNESAVGSLKAGPAGTTHIVAMVVAAAAPIATAIVLIPLGMLLGNGIGFPGAIVMVALVLALFAVGFVKIQPFIKNTGAFYAYISAGLGRPAGLASAYVLSVSYAALGASVLGGFGFYGHTLLQKYFNLNIPWLVLAIIAVVVATTLAVGGIEVSARILFIILALELLALVVLDASILIQNGIPSFTFQVFNPDNIFSGAVGVAAIYGFSMFLGFETTAVYAEEVTNPRRSVPRATFIILALVGVFYAFASWSMVAGTGSAKLLDTVGQNPGEFVFTLSDRFVGPAWTDLIGVLITLSLFAGILAFQNATARYFFALGRDGMAPSRLGHTRHNAGTPIVALIVVGVVFVGLSVVYSVAGLDPLLEMGTSLVGVGTIGLVVVMSIASLSIGIFFIRKRTVGVATVLAPLVSAVMLGFCAAAGVQNYGALTGAQTWWINNLAWLLIPVAVIGLAYSFWVRSKDKERYEAIGRTRI